MNRSVQVAFCGISAAFSTVIMLLAGVVPTATYAISALAGVFTIAIVMEMNIGWAFASYVVSAGISVLIVPDKSAVLLYVIFFGFYPILKAIFERIQIKVIAYLLKLAVFNVAAICAYIIAIALFMLKPESLVIFGISIPWVLLLIGNVIFIIYDFALSGLVVAYYKRLHPIFSKWMMKK